jgi:hypothetical protein
VVGRMRVVPGRRAARGGACVVGVPGGQCGQGAGDGGADAGGALGPVFVLFRLRVSAGGVQPVGVGPGQGRVPADPRRQAVPVGRRVGPMVVTLWAACGEDGTSAIRARMRERGVAWAGETESLVRWMGRKIRWGGLESNEMCRVAVDLYAIWRHQSSEDGGPRQIEPWEGWVSD